VSRCENPWCERDLDGLPNVVDLPASGKRYPGMTLCQECYREALEMLRARYARRRRMTLKAVRAAGRKP